MQSTAETGRYIIRGADDGPALAVFLAGIHGDPSLRLVDTVGPPDRPHTAVIETDAQTAKRLEASFRHANQLMIEPDRPLSLFD
jgi:hypothetical protein